MNILKFGGSSVGTPQRIRTIIDIVTTRLESGENLSIVVSAFGGVTNQLIEMSSLAASGSDSYLALFHQFKERHNEAVKELAPTLYMDVQADLDRNHEELRDLLKGILLVREASPRTKDYVLSFGERNSAFIISLAFKETGIEAAYLDARSIIKTNKKFNAAKVRFDKTNTLIENHFKQSNAQLNIITGFISSDIGGLTTTLGRGGSDYTAAIIAAGLNADRLEIWTDVDGVLTSDPRKVSKAFTIPKLSYAEAMEMSHFGAKVIYPPTIQPALQKGIPIYIKNTFNPGFEGTLISNESAEDFPSIIKGVSAMNKVSLLKIQGSGLVGKSGMSGRFFGALGKGQINIILIVQASSEHAICVAIKSDEVKSARLALEEEFEKEIANKTIHIPASDDACSIITVVGEEMKSAPGVAGKLFSTLGKNGINVNAIAQGSSELNISLVIDDINESKALNAIHDAFYMSEYKQVNLFIVGLGLIGKELISQIKEQREDLKERLKIELNVVGISNSRKMLLHTLPIDIEDWEKQLDEFGEQANIEVFIDKMVGLNLPNAIFIDNTASGIVPAHYEKILSQSISVATPNKIAASQDSKSYQKLKKIASDNRVQFRYETNVGAGLPVLNTIQNLVNSGDVIYSIEAVSSGSLSYIFNNFDGSKPFSQLVREARELGFTEPDPRDDLSGMDVKRKIIILSREAGYQVEPQDVSIASILPSNIMDAPSIEEFFNRLEAHDDQLKQLVEEAKQKDSTLRFVATASPKGAFVSLEKIASNHPLSSLESSDNMFIIHSQRYRERPLIIRGPGAGASVTAAGVFGDILMMI